MTGRWRALTAALVGIVMTLTGCGSAPPEHLDASGLVVIPDTRDRAVPENLRDAYSAYDLLTESFPADFGYASPNLVDGQILVGVVTPHGKSLLSAFAGGVPPADPPATGGGPEEAQKRAQQLSAAAVRAPGLNPVAVQKQQSRHDTEALMDSLIDWAPRFPDAHIWMTNVETSTGMVILGAEALTPSLASALVDAYGTDRVVVQVGERPPVQATVGMQRRD